MTYHVILVSTHDEYDISIDKATLDRLIEEGVIEYDRKEEKEE